MITTTTIIIIVIITINSSNDNNNKTTTTTALGVSWFWNVLPFSVGRDSVVGIETRYGPDGPGIKFRWGEVFLTYPDRPRGPPSLL
jgi:hypothetical protein